MRFFTILTFASAFLFLNACKKKTQHCDQTETFSLVSNGPVISGWPIILSAENYEDYTYHWKGPNGWSLVTQYSFDTYEQWKVTKDSATLNDSGVYSVELIDQAGCIIKRGSVNVQVIDPPLPPCSTANNSSTTTLGGVGGTTYSTVSHSGGMNYSVYATNGNQTINFVFEDGSEPKPGMYLVESGYFPSEKDHVAVYIQSGFYDFFMESYYTVYVNKVNGKLQFAFCTAPFSNPVSQTPIIISAKVTLP